MQMRFPISKQKFERKVEGLMKLHLTILISLVAFGLLACRVTPKAGSEPEKAKEAVAAPAAATVNPNAPATGSWTWSFTSPRGSYEMTGKFTQEGEKLTGTVTGRNGSETPISEGSVKGNAVSFKVTRERQGRTSTSTYTGTISGDAITGKVEMTTRNQPRSIDWSAKRAG